MNNMKKIGHFNIFCGRLIFEFDTSTAWSFPLDYNGKVDLNKFGVDLRWRMSIMAKDINNHHKTNFNRRQIQNMINSITTDAKSDWVYPISVDEKGNLIWN